jgi:hypothetical protein
VEAVISNTNGNLEVPLLTPLFCITAKIVDGFGSVNPDRDPIIPSPPVTDDSRVGYEPLNVDTY